MKVYYVGRSYRTNAVGEYNPKTKELIVKKGSVVSENIASFKMAESVRALRKENVDRNGVLKRDLLFRSPSYAAAFVTGFSANGLTAWRIDNKTRLKDIL